MPYNPGTGIYSLPAVYLAIPATTILATQHNTPLEDLEVANNYPRPVVAGGTGANNAASARTNLGIAAPLVIPVGTVSDYAGTSAPSLWLLMFGQAVSRTTYAALFAVIGSTYGGGDGSTTFNLPDLRGRVSAGKDDMGGVSANRLTSPINGDNLAAAGGAEGVALSTAEVNHSHAAAGHTHSWSDTAATGNASVDHQHGYVTGSGGTVSTTASGSLHTHTVTVSGTTSNTSLATGAVTSAATAHNNVQPTIILNKIIYAGV